MARVDELLKLLKERNASDLHLSAGLPPRIRVRGEIESVEGWAPLDDSEVRALLMEIAEDGQWREFEDVWDLDFAYGLPGVARFRANYLMQDRGAAAVFRIIPEEVQSLSELGVPDAVAALADVQKGLVLVTGPTGSGKSTTLAAIIDSINRNHERHIVTIEEPVEFVHTNRKSVVSHREVGTHTNGFADALRAVIRQDADVVLVGEMRDRETIAMAVTAAEMGLLVFGTLHTNGAAKTIGRIIDAFPADEQEQVRISLSESLTAVVSQLLLPTSDGRGRVAVHEILLRTAGLANIIREGNTVQVQSLIQSGKAQGMQLMDDALFALLKEQKILPMDAYRKAVDKSRFEAMVGEPTGSAA